MTKAFGKDTCDNYWAEWIIVQILDTYCSRSLDYSASVTTSW